MVRNKLLVAAILAGAATGYANKPTTTQFTPASSYLLALKPTHLVFQTGAYWGTQGADQHIDIQDLIGDQFTVTKHHSSNALLGLGIYTQDFDMGHFLMSYGLNAFYLPNASVTGTIVQENLFTNLSYTYNVSHYPLYVMAQSSTSLFANKAALTINAGIGPNFLSTSGFREYPLEADILPDAPFSRHTTTTFSATAGVGIRLNHALNSLPLECGYQFYYLGKGELQKNTAQLLNTLNTGTTYANAVLCSVRI